jgi:hypothetical protein
MNASRRERLLASAVEDLGAESFNRLVSSASQTRAKGRLRFWQEELIAKLATDDGVPIATVEEFLEVFQNAKLQAIPEEPLTREQFLADPVRRYRRGIDPAWIVEAFRSGGRFQEDVIDWISRSVSKIGTMEQAEFWVGVLSGRLDGPETVHLYECVRDRSQRLEFEWRAEFEKAFPLAVGLLPARQDGWYTTGDKAEPSVAPDCGGST